MKSETPQEKLEMEEKFQLIQFSIDRAADGISWIDPEGRIIYANDEACRRHGYTRKEIMKLTAFDINPTLTPHSQAAMWSELRRKGTIRLESEHRGRNGEIFPVEILIQYIRFGDKEYSFAFMRDITERKLAERERIANLKYFESMEKVNQAIQGSWNDLDLVLSRVLDVCLSVFDCDRAFLLHPCDPEAPFWSVPVERTRPEYPGNNDPGKRIPIDSNGAEYLQTALAAPGPVSFYPGSIHSLPEEVLEAHGVWSQMIIALHTKIGKPWLFGLHQCGDARIWTAEEEGLFEKIARRLTDSLTSLLMYRDLRKSEEFLNSIVENIPDMIFVKEAEELRLLRINRAGEKLLGIPQEDQIGKNLFDLMPKEQAIRYTESDREVLEKGVLVEIPEEIVQDSKGGQHIVRSKKIPILDETGKPRHLLVIAEDITELKKLQAQLIHAQKLEALGTMSGGIAHDFNNILQPMLGYSEFLMRDLPAGNRYHKFVEGIYNAVLRAKDLVNQILVFSRQSDHKMVQVVLPQLLKEAVNLCRSIIPSNIEIIRDIQKECASVSADPTQLHQIVMNLMINAYHAMEETGGKIFVSLKEIELGEDDRKGINLPPGKYSKLSVTDTGCGMAPAIMEKIFEPYFTTKAQGKGSGLGLAVVYGIVKEHGGHINVYSEEGKGSTFNVYLPVMEKASETPPAEPPKTFPAAGHEHILLVDDEEMIVELESRLLERFGYRVTSCHKGTEALEIFRASPNAFNLVVTDMNMPNMTGDRLARELIAIRPDIPIIICTGFSERISSAEVKAIGVKAFLMKPITVSEMTEKVRKVLDQAKK